MRCQATSQQETYQKRDSGTGVFLQILRKFEEHSFYKAPPNGCFGLVSKFRLLQAFLLLNVYYKFFQLPCFLD